MGAVTLNFLPKSEINGSISDLTDSQIFDNGTNVGVGTSTPPGFGLLDVEGDIALVGGSRQLVVQNSFKITTAEGWATADILEIGFDVGVNQETLTLKVPGPSGFVDKNLIKGQGNSVLFLNQQSDDSYSMVLSDDGRVGVGVTPTFATLDVSGDVAIIGSSRKLIVQNSFKITTEEGWATADILEIGFDGGVGQETLIMKVPGPSGFVDKELIRGQGNSVLNLNQLNDDSYTMTMNDLGNVGIGANPFDVKFEVNGSSRLPAITGSTVVGGNVTATDVIATG